MTIRDAVTEKVLLMRNFVSQILKMDDADNLDDLLAGYDPFADLDNDTNQQTNKNNNITSTFDPLASTSKSRSRDNNLPLKRKRPFKQLDAELYVNTKPTALFRMHT